MDGLVRVLTILLLLAGLALPGGALSASFWEEQKKGANLFNETERAERFQMASQIGLDFVRLAPNKWLNGRPEGQRGDFLLGPPDAYQGLIAPDLAYLRQVLDWAEAAGQKVVLTMLSLPCNRWRQHNDGVQQRAIWQSFDCQDQAVEFWVELVQGLHGHPALVGYNIKNEPSPERAGGPSSGGKLADWFSGDYASWQASIAGSPADLNLFYRKAVAAIRAVDPDTPIILDSGFFATPWAFKVLEPVDDAAVLYSFHMYEPYKFTNHRNKGKYRYPGRIPTGEAEDGEPLYWDRETMRDFLAPIRDWQARHQIAANRILLGEFGVYRKNEGAETYLADIIHLANEEGWHWAFYGFRESSWDGMDYELGSRQKLGRWDKVSESWTGYYTQVEKGIAFPGLDFYHPNPLFDAILAGLRE